MRNRAQRGWVSVKGAQLARRKMGIWSPRTSGKSSERVADTWPLGVSIRTLGVKLSTWDWEWRGLPMGVKPRTSDWGALKTNLTGLQVCPGGADVFVLSLFVINWQYAGIIKSMGLASGWHTLRGQFQLFSVGMNLGKLFKSLSCDFLIWKKRYRCLPHIHVVKVTGCVSSIQSKESASK